MKKVLINFAHPARSRSKMNKALRHSVESLDGVFVNDLYAQYPDFMIDVEREQKLCEAHDVIIFQHPFYWYSTPAIVKEWLDLVLQHDWAYGSQGKALQGKILMQALTAGGDHSTYSEQGYNQFTIRELTYPMQATAKLCNLSWIPPFAVLGIHRGLAHEKVIEHAENYRRLIIALRENTLNLDQVHDAEFVNSNLDAVIGGA